MLTFGLKSALDYWVNLKKELTRSVSELSLAENELGTTLLLVQINAAVSGATYKLIRCQVEQTTTITT